MLSLRPMKKETVVEFLSKGEPSTFEYFKANVSDGFDNSSLGVGLDYVKELYAAAPEEGASKEQAQENIRAYYEKRERRIVDPESPQPKSFSLDDWKKSEHFREGINWQDGWSEERAKHMAEAYDERSDRALTMSVGRESDRVLTGSGIVGQLVGGLPDPINLVPFGGAVGKGAKIGEKLVRGAIEGAVGNLAVSAIARPYYENRGVESTWVDYANDLWIGGVMGGGFSLGGHAISKARERRANVSLESRKAMADAGDAAIESVKTGNDLNLSKVEGLQKAFDSVWDIPEVKKSQKAQELVDQLTGIEINVDGVKRAMTPDEAKAHTAFYIAHAEAYAKDFDMDLDSFIDKYGFDFQASEVVGNGKAARIKKRATSEVDVEIRNIIDSEIQNMKMEIEGAEAGRKLFNQGGYAGSQESTFPQWFRDLGFKSKQEFLDAVEKKTSKFDDIEALVKDKLAGTDPEYQALTGEGMADIPTGPDGKPLFKKSKGKERGAITFQEDSKAIIHLFENADQSTIIHETGHLFLNNLERMSKLDNAPDRIKADFEAIKAWAGIEPGGKIETKHHEKFARGFEQFVREGKAPRPELQGVFTRFKDWLSTLYKSSKDLKVKLSDDARDVYSRLLGSESRPRVDSAPEKALDDALPPSKAIEVQDGELETMIETSPHLITKEELDGFKESLGELDIEDLAIDEVSQFFQGARTDEALLAAANKVGISKSQFERIVDDFNEQLIADADARLGIDAIIQKRKIEIAAEKAELKRQAKLSLEARTEVLSSAKKIIEAGGNYRDAILAQIEGASHLRGIEGAGKSADGAYMAIAQSNSIKVWSDLRKLDPKIEKLFENDVQFNGNVLKEMINPGTTGDELASKAAKILSESADNLRERANLAGAKIGKLEGWTARTHDVEKLVSQGEDAWISFMMDGLDMDRVFPDLNEGGKREALSEIYASLVTGKHESAEISLTEPLRRPPRNIAKKMGESRSLHFKNAEVELKYLQEFGQGDNILESMSKHYEGMSRRIALMERFGPNPENTIAHTIDTLHGEIKQKIIDKKIDPKKADKLLKQMGNTASMKSRDSMIGKAMMFALGEVDAAHSYFKDYARLLRSWNSFSKLGSALLSQPGDMIHAVNERKILSDKNVASHWIESFEDYLSKPSPELQEVIDHVGIFADGFNFSNFNRFDVDNVNSRLSRGMDWMFKWSGQNWHVRNSKKAAALSLSREMGSNIGKSWKEMSPGLRETLVQYGGFTEAKWKKLQLAKSVEVDGKAYYHPGLIDEIPDSAFTDSLSGDLKERPQDLLDADTDSPELKSWEERRAKEIKRARNKLDLDLRTFFVEESRNAAPDTDAKVKRVISAGQKPGTKMHETMKLLTQFKTFSFVNYDRSIKGRRMMKHSSDIGGVAHHAVSALALGYISFSLKSLVKGQTPPDPTLPETWGQAALQSGGLGIMGDFFGSAVSARSGADIGMTVLGPSATTILGGAKLATEALHGSTYEDGSKYASKWVHMARANAPAPFSTLWYTRAAMDYLVWERLKETLEPGSTRRSERRLKKNFNQKYLYR